MPGPEMELKNMIVSFLFSFDSQQQMVTIWKAVNLRYFQMTLPVTTSALYVKNWA